MRLVVADWAEQIQNASVQDLGAVVVFTYQIQALCEARIKGKAASGVDVTPPIDDLMTVPEVARLLHVQDQTIWRYAKEGRLDGVKVGARALRIKRASLEAILNERKTRRTTDEEA